MLALVARDLHLSMVAQNLAAISGLSETIARAALYAAADSYWLPATLLEATAQLEAALGGQDSTHPIVAAFWQAASRESIEQRGTSTPPLPIPIPYEGGDELIHTSEQPFCDDMRCPCHEDRESIEQVQVWVTAGLLSAEDADRIYRGQPLA